MFKGILKIRVGWVLEAIKLYMQMFPGDKSLETYPIESYSPYELRQLLQQVLTVSDWQQEKQ